MIRILKQSAHPHSSKCVQISPVVFCCSTTTEDSLQSCVVITELRTDGTALSEMPLLDKHNTVVDRCDTRRIVGCAISLFREGERTACTLSLLAPTGRVSSFHVEELANEAIGRR